METIAKYIDSYFLKLVEKYGFCKENERVNGESYSIEYHSTNIIIKLEKYHQQIYVTLYKPGASDEINLFNLLDYLYTESPDTPKSNYFMEERDINKKYRKQLSYITATIYDNFEIISTFFSNGNYELKVAEIDSYMQNKYPNLFKRS